jgi:NDP-sugar pyrophosphorylase family protein
MSDSVAGIVLAAGGGSRLSPLTSERPKALCPVGGAPLVDRALAAVARVTADLAVNAFHGAGSIEAHVRDRAFLSVERELLGVGGGLANLRAFIDGRPALVVNVDAVHDADLAEAAGEWDGDRIGFVAAVPPGAAFGPGMPLCGVFMPPWAVASLPSGPGGIYEAVWAPAAQAGRTQVISHRGMWFDAGTPRDYLAANLWVGDGMSVVGEGAVVDGTIDGCVVWDRATVRRGEVLHSAIRTTRGRTVLVRSPAVHGARSRP